MRKFIKEKIFKLIMNNVKSKYGYIGREVYIPASLKGITYPANIFIEDYASLGSEVVMYATSESKIVIGKGSFIAPRCKMITSNHNFNSFNLKSIPFDNVNYVKDIIIKEGVWLGDSVIVLPGVTIGKGSVIGGGSVVTKDIPEYAVAAGNPARIISYRNKEIFDLLLSENKFNRAIDWKLEGGKKFVRLKDNE